MAKDQKKLDNMSPYHLSLIWSGETLPFNLLQVKQAHITLDINKLLPSFKINLQDSEHVLSEMIPFDNKFSRVLIVLNRNTRLEEPTSFNFETYRRFPDSTDVYPFEGLLQVSNLFAPSRMRAFTGTIQNTLETIASELKIDTITMDTNISPGLEYNKTIVQPNWTNGELIQYLKKHAIGKGGEGGFYCFIKCVKQKMVFVFRTIKELYNQQVKYTFVNSPNPDVDSATGDILHPMTGYKVFDNFKILGIHGCKQIDYNYFNYNATADDVTPYIADSLKIQGNDNEADDYFSLTDYYSIDTEDKAEDNVSISDNGRGNSFTSDFKGRAKNYLHRRANNLSKISITTWGLEDAYPGDIVNLRFLKDIVPDKALSYSYFGLWMIEKVTHICGTDFFTQLLLTRNGINTEERTTLLSATSKKNL